MNLFIISTKKYTLLLFLTLLLFACKKTSVTPIPDPDPESPPVETPYFLRAVDISSLPEIEQEGTLYYNASNQQEDLLSILKTAGVNTIRIRLWKNPATSHSSFSEVKAFASRAHAMDLDVWLTVHYSDTWADPGKQATPAVWQNLSFSVLKDSVYAYTTKIMKELKPEFIQIGNEINPGFLLPSGNINTNEQQFKDLLAAGSKAVRDNSSTSKIILHFAGLTNSDWFFSKVKYIDYDLIGLSYYPYWHGKDLVLLESSMKNLSSTYHIKILIAETAYPFTLDWNDWTNNLIGSDGQLILPTYPPTPEGQKAFITKIRTLVESVEDGVGFSYWGAELVAYRGSEAQNGSPWENQALFDFNNKALPVLDAFKKE
ncbi:MAG: glycosyl hydrolase 53 family protein [Bacteroidales bacterium]|nr:glycosyl hydrolase 53 family protein [Bacteroidales bacterium]